MFRTGDISKNFEKLKNELAQIKFPAKLDLNDFKDGNPLMFLPIIHYTVLSYSKFVAEHFLNNNYELFSKPDKQFMEQLFHALIHLYNYKPSISVNQFFTNGYSEAKILFCYDLVKLIRREHNYFLKKFYSHQTKQYNSIRMKRSQSPVSHNNSNSNNNTLRKKTDEHNRSTDSIKSNNSNNNFNENVLIRKNRSLKNNLRNDLMMFEEENPQSYNCVSSAYNKGMQFNQFNHGNNNVRVIRHNNSNSGCGFVNNLNKQNESDEGENDFHVVEDDYAEIISPKFNDTVNEDLKKFKNIEENQEVRLKENINKNKEEKTENLKELNHEVIPSSSIKNNKSAVDETSNNTNNVNNNNKDKEKSEINSMVHIMNSLATTIKNISTNFETFKSNMECRLGKLEAENTLLKNTIIILEEKLNNKILTTFDKDNKQHLNDHSSNNKEDSVLFSFANEEKDKLKNDLLVVDNNMQKDIKDTDSLINRLTKRLELLNEIKLKK